MFYGIVGVLKGVSKIFTKFTGKHLCRLKCKPKSFINQCSLHLHCKRDIYTSCFSVSSAEFLKLGSHQMINPDSIAKLAINKKLSQKWR